MLPSVTRVSAGAIRRVATVGEPDLFRALQTLPGITSPSQASNQPYIRGGSPDQNLVRLDGAPIYNPFHLSGLAADILYHTEKALTEVFFFESDEKFSP